MSVGSQRLFLWSLLHCFIVFGNAQTLSPRGSTTWHCHNNQYRCGDWCSFILRNTIIRSWCYRTSSSCFTRGIIYIYSIDFFSRAYMNFACSLMMPSLVGFTFVYVLSLVLASLQMHTISLLSILYQQWSVTFTGVLKITLLHIMLILLSKFPCHVVLVGLNKTYILNR